MALTDKVQSCNDVHQLRLPNRQLTRFSDCIGADRKLSGEFRHFSICIFVAQFVISCMKEFVLSALFQYFCKLLIFSWENRLTNLSKNVKVFFLKVWTKISGNFRQIHLMTNFKKLQKQVRLTDTAQLRFIPLCRRGWTVGGFWV